MGLLTPLPGVACEAHSGPAHTAARCGMRGTQYGCSCCFQVWHARHTVGLLTLLPGVACEEHSGAALAAARCGMQGTQ